MGTWTNWAGDQACVPARVETPTSREHLAEVVARAAADGLRVKVPGSGHSFTAAALTGGVMVRTDRLDRVLEVDLDRHRVRVEAGIVLADLNVALDRHGLALPNLGDIDHQTLAGAIATATHGTGARLPNLAAQVVALELVTGDGTVHQLTGGDDLLAARVAIGALGAVTAVTLQCVPAFVLHRVDEPRPVDDVLADLDALADDNDHFEFFVFPGADTALTIRRNRTDQPPRPRGRVEEFVNERVLQNVLGDVLMKVTRARPALIPAFARLATRLLSEGEYVDRSFRVFASRRDIRFTEMEYAVPRADGPRVVRQVLDLLARQEHPTAFPVEVRVVRGDDALLSPTHARDSVYVAVHQYRGMAWQPLFTAVEAIMTDVGGRPHWGKRHQLTYEQLRPRYPRFDDFLAVRDRLDPDRVFANHYTETVLGP